MADVQAPAAEQPKESITDAAGPDAQVTNGDAPATAAEDIDAGNADVTEVKDIDGETSAVAVADGAPEATSNTTATASKARRKSAGGVPEHKTKKLNKKKSMVTLNLNLKPGDYVWARLKGYPPWPSVVCDEAMLPESLLGNRPVSAMRPDGTYREDFLEGGKNERDRKFPIMFLSTNEFAWMVNTQLTRLEKSELDKDDNAKMAPALKHAYVVAREENDLDHYKDLLRQHEQEQKEIEKELNEKEEEKAAKAAEKEKKKAEQQERRKSKVAADDEMDVDEEGKPSKKRKKEADSEGEGKPKKTPKVKTAKEPKPESAAKSKPKKKAGKPAEEATPEFTPAQMLERREKAVFFIRHKLQRSLLSGTTPPSDDEMPVLAEFFTQLEQYKDLEPHLIRKTKIHKVLKNIVRLDNIPRDEELGFKKRSAEMLNHWNSVLASSAEAETPVAEAAPTTTNGEAKATAAEGAEQKETKTEEAKEDKPSDAGDADVTMADSSTADVKADEEKPATAGEEKPAAEEAKPAATETSAEPTTSAVEESTTSN